jgi:FdhE protein
LDKNRRWGLDGACSGERISETSPLFCEALEDVLKKLEKRIESLKEKKPHYAEILDFYYKVRQQRERVKLSLKTERLPLKHEWRDLLRKEGFPLLQRQDFPLDLESSAQLFKSLCQVAKKANPFISEQTKRIEGILEERGVDLGPFLRDGLDEKKIEKTAEDFHVDKKVLAFLMQNSTKPSIEASRTTVQDQVEAETWLKGYCPVCGSLPFLSLLKEETGKRFLVCSFCSHEWRADRISCPFCENKEPGSLQFFQAEGEELYRIDLCEKCHQYIKTIDARVIEVFDPSLEDLATLHLDLVASKKGYRRPVSNPWIP